MRGTRFSRTLVRIAVGTGVGLAPYLGKVQVPGFSALLELFPSVLQDKAIPVSSALMGVIAACVEYFRGEKTDQASAKRWFVRISAFAIVILFALMIVDVLGVTSIPFEGGRARVSFVTGIGQRSPMCAEPCSPSDSACVRCETRWSDEECIERISFKESSIQTCFGSFSVKLASALLLSLYIGFMGLLAGAVAILTVTKVGHAPEHSHG